MVELASDQKVTLDFNDYCRLVDTLAVRIEASGEKRPDWLLKHRQRIVRIQCKFLCCENEQRNMNGWCTSCGDPCI